MRLVGRRTAGAAVGMAVLMSILGGGTALPAIGAPPPPAVSPRPADTRKENKALVRRYLTELLAAGKLDKADEIVAKTFTDRSPGAPNLRGVALVRQLRGRLQSLFSQIEYDPQEMTAEDDRVAARYLVLATPKPERGQPSPQPLVLNGIALFRVKAGRVQEVFVLNDQVGLLHQLGYTLVPPGAQPAPAAPPVPSAPSPQAPPAANHGN